MKVLYPVMQNKSHSAFALFETCLVLLIVSSLMIFTSVELRLYQDNIQEKIALKNFEETFKNAVNYSYLQKNFVSVLFYSQKVVFKSAQYNVSIPLPSSLKVYSDHLMIHPLGVTSPKYLDFFSTKFQQNYRYTVNMDWGVLDGPKITSIHHD